MIWFLIALKKYGDFEGRARRREYWYFQLFSALIQPCVAWLDVRFGLTNNYQTQVWDVMVASNNMAAVLINSQKIGYLSVVYTLLMIIPGYSVQVRRLHDTGRSGIWVLSGLFFIYPLLIINFQTLASLNLPDFILIFLTSFPMILLLLNIIPLIFCLLDSDKYANKYGLNPKEAA
jgi:uncharacterized membrane protein YhaH (DUF805 family)